MRVWHALIALVAVCSAFALSSDVTKAKPKLTVIVSAPLPVDLARLTWTPARAARLVGATASGWPQLVVDPRLAGDEIVLQAPGACPLSVSVHVDADEIDSSRMSPLFSVQGENPQLGYDAPFELTLVPNCAEASLARVEWQPAKGITVSSDGRTVRGRTPRFEEAHPDPVPWGVVPLSPRTRGAIELESRWRDLDGTVVKTVRVAAAARATGIPIIPPGQRVHLGGAGWRVKERVESSRAEVVSAQENLPATFEPDAVGRWVLTDDAERSLVVTVGRHSQLRLDCGRAECHPRAADEATDSPMTTILARGLRGELGAEYVPECAIACHAVGEPGMADGGFDNVARALGYQLPHHPAPELWRELPRSLRRLGGVGCTACHGPAAIPEPESRWAILRSDVCATCHDAPPRYRHVEAWRSSRMSKAEDKGPGCDGCHGVVGFLARIGSRQASPPRDPIGISCQACHAPHEKGASGHALIRRVKLPARYDALDPERDAATRLCLSCHAPLGEELWFRDGPHRAVPGGCVGCHMSGKDGSGHTFRAVDAACKSCHPNGAPKADARIAERARAIRDRAGPPHATPDRVAKPVDRVLEDPAAWVHNAPYARALLEIGK